MLSSVQDAEDRGKNKMSSSCHGAYTPEDRGVEPRYGHDLEGTLQETAARREKNQGTLVFTEWPGMASLRRRQGCKLCDKTELRR